MLTSTSRPTKMLLAQVFLVGLISFAPAPSGCTPVATDNIGSTSSGHYVTYQGKDLLLIGDSGTQVVTQNLNIDYRSWIDDCASRGIRAIHVWSFMAPRQKQDGSVVEERYGYVYPGVTPWPRKTDGPPAADQLPQWDLTLFDDGPDEEHTKYWPRMRDLCRYAQGKRLIVGYTVFTGWIKGNHDAWEYHPFNVANGGHLEKNLPDAVAIESPGVEIWDQPWSDAWSKPKKTQWVWERLAKKVVDELGPFGNVFFVFYDEHSYTEGNMGDHFRDFFHKRNQIWVDWEKRRSSVDWVMSETFADRDKNSDALRGFNGSPPRPYFFLEGDPYQGEAVRQAIWTQAIGGGHYFFHNDAGQETPRTGVMGYDPNIPGGDKATYKRDWLGHASRFFNEEISELDAMAPRNDLTSDGAYCLAAPGREYALYCLPGSASAPLDLTKATGEFSTRFFDPRSGAFHVPFTIQAGGVRSLEKPDERDWVVHVSRREGGK